MQRLKLERNISIAAALGLVHTVDVQPCGKVDSERPMVWKFRYQLHLM